MAHSTKAKQTGRDDIFMEVEENTIARCVEGTPFRQISRAVDQLETARQEIFDITTDILGPANVEGVRPSPRTELEIINDLDIQLARINAAISQIEDAGAPIESSITRLDDPPTSSDAILNLREASRSVEAAKRVVTGPIISPRNEVIELEHAAQLMTDAVLDLQALRSTSLFNCLIDEQRDDVEVIFTEEEMGRVRGPGARRRTQLRELN